MSVAEYPNTALPPPSVHAMRRCLLSASDVTFDCSRPVHVVQTARREEPFAGPASPMTLVGGRGT